jgi:hypothetical protein
VTLETVDDDLDDLMARAGIERYKPPPYDGIHDYDDHHDTFGDYPWWLIAFAALLWLTAGVMAIVVGVAIWRR